LPFEDAPVDRYIHWQVSVRIWSEMLARSVFQKRVTIVERRLHSHEGKFVDAELYWNTRRRETGEGLTTRGML
jgi:hypothetical protein